MGKLFSVEKVIKRVVKGIGHSFLHDKSKTKLETNFSVQEPKHLATKRIESSPNKTKVLMFGWELPPFNSGGLGVACYNIAESIAKQNAEVTFVLPKKQEIDVPFMKLVFADQPSDISVSSRKKHGRNLKIREINSLLSPYLTESSYRSEHEKFLYWLRLLGYKGRYNLYGSELFDEVLRYADEAEEIAKEENFEVIHAHDWLAYPAGIMAKKISKKPLVAHVHALEQDRSHEDSLDPRIVRIEKMGFEKADKIIAISNYVKDRIIKYYRIPASKIEVVHNGINISHSTKKKFDFKSLKSNGQKMVLFVGRITYQKGVDYLVKAAHKALAINPNIFFVIAGSGDMQYQIMQETARLGISDKVFFPGFLRAKQLEKLYDSADVFVMPSVSEPFGLVALEALAKGVPVILSNQSGAAEVIPNSLKVDFWNTDDLANKIVAVLNHDSLRGTLSDYGFIDAKNCTWDLAAEKCIKIYKALGA